MGNKKGNKKVVRTMEIIPGLVVFCIVLLIGVLLACSPGKVELYLDDYGKPINGSISEKIRVHINGVDQGMFIKGKDMTKPVLLFLHGGPGMPEYTFFQKYPTGLEDHFIVCYWDQRGAGLSFSASIPPETITVKQLIEDTLEVTHYLCKRFGQEKIYLMGHSGGSFIGMQAAARSPELYQAYIGVSQMANQLISEKLAYNYMVEEFRKAGDNRMLEKMQKFPIDEMDSMPNAYRPLRDEAMHKLGVGTMRDMRSVVTGIFIPTWQNREYTLSEKLGLWRGKWSNYSTNMWNHMIATDLTEKVPKLDIPVYFIHGIYDYTIVHSLTEDYFKKLQAPLKGFYTFKHSAHSPMFEEPEKTQQILKDDVLAGTNNLADFK